MGRPGASLLIAIALGGCASSPAVVTDAGLDAAGSDAARDAIDVLAFSRTTGFRHASIGPAHAALDVMAAARGWRVEHTEDPARFSDAELARFEVVVFLLTTGDVLDAPEESALERFVRAGGGWVGVHSASDTEYDWPFYGRLVGARFARHPAIQRATVRVEDRSHPSTAHLSDGWEREDEWYDFDRNPRADVHVLLTVDESSYSGGEMGADHPIAWLATIESGRSFYTALGHTDASWSEEPFLAHVAGGIEWAAATR